MPTCPVCGGTISAEDRLCPFCSKTILRLDDAADDWTLSTEDAAGVSSYPPAAPAPGTDTSLMQDDWMLPVEASTFPAPPVPVPVPIPEPVPTAPVWSPPLDAGNMSLPPWAPVPAQKPPAAPPEDFDFTFDLDSGSLPPQGAPPPPPPAMDVTAVVPGMDVEAPPWSVPEPTMAFAPVPEPAPVAPSPPVLAPPPTPARPAWACPSCGKMYGAEYRDTFCDCGCELAPAAAPPPPAPAPTAASGTASAAAPQRPPAGTTCLVLYGADKQPRHYFALSKDATLIGRLDPVSGTFPDIDVGEFADEATARKVSRKHALVIRSRSGGGFSLRPLPGNTGTQVNAQLVTGGQDVPLAPGTRLILGGVIRLKLEVM
ncbi:MAG: FHA domain-containing protein [Gemmataceae bacterium]|nr:FHA domain-containing protein [Gemmataceae bacterium]